MKSLKKTLSLVLVLVMVLGMLGIASATNYTDDADIQYKEAVEVMTGIGVIEGYTNDANAGKFLPKGTITRAEAAKMATYTLIGPKAAEALAGVTSRYTDMGNDKWAIPYVEYLSTVGAVEGIGNNKYNPKGNVTGYEYAKILLAGLGFGSQGEYSGSDWTLNVAVDATRDDVGLTAGRAANAGKLGAAATREECALFSFNALFVEKVQYSALLGRYANTGSSLAPSTKYGTSTATVPTTFPTLIKSTGDATDVDDFGRPASNWYFGTTPAVISSTAAIPVAKFTSLFSQYDLYKALGAEVPSILVTKNDKAGQAAGTALASSKTGTGTYQGGNGVITEVFKDGTDYKAVQIIPEFGTLSSIVPTKATTTTGAYNTYYIDGSVNQGKIFTSVVDSKDDVNTLKITGTVTIGDKVLYYSGAKGHYIEAVGTISGIVKSVTSAGVYTIGSAQTMKARAYTGADPAINDSKEQTFYVDSFGFLLGAKSADVEVPYAMMLGITPRSELINNQIVTTYTATLANLDGSVSKVPTTSAVYSSFYGNTPANALGDTFSYSVNSKGEYTFIPAATASSAAINIDTGITGIQNKNSALAGGTEVTLASNATKFVVANYVDVEGVRVPDGTVTVYTGTNNVPTLSPLSKATAISVKGTVNADTIAEVVFVGDDVSATASTPYIYVVGTYYQTSAGYHLNVIVNGEATTITVNAAGMTDLLVTKGKGLYSEIKLTGTTVSSATKATGAVNSIQNVGNLLFINGAYATGKTIADAVPVYTIYAADNSVAVGTGADLATTVSVTGGIYVSYAADGNTVTAVYIVVPAS